MNLANSVFILQEGTGKDGIRKFIYIYIKSNIALVQTASQLVSIFININILVHNVKRRNMEVWVIDEE